MMNEQVSSCLPLGKETRNFWCYLENLGGNKKIDFQAISQSGKAVSSETSLETKRKLSAHCLETFSPQKLSKSCQTIDDFFVFAQEHNLALLPDDKRWIKTICFGIPSSALNELLSQYTMHWQLFSNREPIQHKKQNVGRRVANEWLREQLITRHRRNHVQIS
ncbi:hypothetical protein [uncultured Legionella sp.]|nr:hypothetical protein [uncultured Legionella sp.]